jgi:predicted nuclease of restriction endonuclease-like RecB superfamily
MSKVISYSTLARQQQLNFLRHKVREYHERDDYLLRLRKLLFQVEAQMRQTEIQQLEVFQEIAAHFKIPLPLPDLGDRLGIQQFFAANPFLQALQDYFYGRLSAEDCLQRIGALKTNEPRPAAD